MSMHKLIDEVSDLVEAEYGRAGAKFGLTNHSDHESYAIILEELQEAKADMEIFESRMAVFWASVKINDDDHTKFTHLLHMQSAAMLGACELIQVAAMCKKAALTVCDRGAIKEFREGEQHESNQ